MSKQVLKWCEIQKKVVPAGEVMVRVPANVAHGYIPDEMPATRSPLDGHYYTSKKKLRDTYRAAGVDEVGNEWESDEKYEREALREEASRQSALAARSRDLMKAYLNGNRDPRKRRD